MKTANYTAIKWHKKGKKMGIATLAILTFLSSLIVSEGLAVLCGHAHRRHKRG